ncbi:aminoimidazole riboside kinase [Pluralibacter gergoviae]|nr:aminoimidazole riboside kinase [Pluralibacter gergoviae]ELW9440896.1 aminoimidazole riboside kinase [Pluralibacter gergoviae]
MSAKVWVLGDAVVDLLPAEGGLLQPCPGGAPANVAVGIARLGGESAFIGRVGGDPFGQMLMQTLAAEGVDVRYMICDEQRRTSTVLVALGDEGERTFTFMVRPGADLFLSVQDLPPFAAGSWLHFCSIALSAEPSRSAAFCAAETLRAAGGFISFDPNIRADLWQDEKSLRHCLQRALALADVVKLSVDELQFLSGGGDQDADICRLAAGYDIGLLLVTEGKAGVRVCWQGEVDRFAAVPAAAVDTTGAGDAFVAGLLAALAENGLPRSRAALEQPVALAQRCGGLAVTARGAMTALPYRRDI